MDPDEMVTAIVSAAIAVIVPSALKQFWPEAEPTESVPWFSWLVAGFVGGALGGAASGAMGLAWGGIGNWAAFGAAIGLMQWVALRGYRPVGTWFVVASAFGWTTFVLGARLTTGPDPWWGWIVAGAAVGILQSLSLARWRGAFWWIPANVIAWPIAGTLGIIVGTPLRKDAPVLAWILGWGVVGLVGAVILLAPLTQLKARHGPSRQPA
jgi:hypothetical protein